MLLYPAVDKLNEQVPNRYLLVNVVARKAREIADDAESLGEHLSEKPVTLAINGVAAGEVEVDREDLYNALNADERIVVPSAPTMVDIPEEEMEELTRDEILQLNRMKNRYSRRQIRSFVLDRMEDGRYTVTSDTVSSLEDFEKLVLAYDDSVRKDSPYRVLDQEAPMVEHAGYRYPGLVFVRKE